MAARALVPFISDVQSTGASSAFLMVRVVYFQDSVQGSEAAEIPVGILWTDTLAQVKTKIVNEVISYGLNGYGLTIAASAILMPTMATGA